MASLEDLPADQRAVLQMVLQRARTYDEIASVLSIDRSSVRQRALDACDALTPDGIEPGPEQALVTDYLLSQLPAQVADQVYVYLEAADDERHWAAAIAHLLAPLASRPLPQIPVAAPLRSDPPVVTGDPATPLEDHARPAPEALAAAPARSESPPARPPRERTHSTVPARKRRPWTLIPALGVGTAIVVVLLIVLISSGGSTTPKKIKPRRTYTYTNTNATTTSTGTGTATTTTGTTTSTGTQILAALNLTSPVGATQTLGVAQVVRVAGVVGIVIDAQGVPQNSAHNAYGVWLYNSATSNRFLGFDRNLVGKNGKLAIEGTLPAHAARRCTSTGRCTGFSHLLITLETQQHPTTPGEVVLSGPFREK
jgi:Sigma-70, region 4